MALKLIASLETKAKTVACFKVLFDP